MSPVVRRCARRGTGEDWHGFRLRWATAAVAAGAAEAAIVLAAVPVPAQAMPGWRIETVFGGSDLLDVQAIAASGADNAWLLGLVPVPGPLRLVIQRWNGSRWVPVALPARLGSPRGLAAGIYTTSPGDTWFFPVSVALSGAKRVLRQYALRVRGSGGGCEPGCLSAARTAGARPDQPPEHVQIRGMRQ